MTIGLSPSRSRVGTDVALAAACAIAAALSASLPAAAQAGLPPGNLCASAGHRRFDFWVGRWDVFHAGTGALYARSLVENLYGGCALRENWMPLAGAGGGSLNSYRPQTRSWRQVWTDSGNEVHEYSGGPIGSKMVLTGRAIDSSDRARRVRMTFEPRRDGSVVQTGFKWSSAKRRWELDYQLEYRPAR